MIVSNRQVDERKTAATRRRYERIASIYDLMEFFAERRYAGWRRRLWSQVQGEKILEVGVGTGKNLPFHPRRSQVTAIDLAPGMLARAARLACREQLSVDLRLGDVQNLEFANESFHAVVATFVFCSVPDPVLGLQEVRRILRPGGKVYLIDHVRSENPMVGWLMDLLNPLVAHLMGPNINRRTVENVRQSGLVIEQVEEIGMGGLFKQIVACKPA